MGTSRLEALTTAIDELLGLEPGELDDDELHDTVVGLLRQSHRVGRRPCPRRVRVGAASLLGG